MIDHHQHVITGNLDIINNQRLRNLLKKGPNFRERNNINLTKAKRSIKQGLEEYVNKWSKKNKKVKVMLTEWKIKVMDRVDDKINTLKKGLLQKWRPDSVRRSSMTESVVKH